MFVTVYVRTKYCYNLMCDISLGRFVVKDPVGYDDGSLQLLLFVTDSKETTTFASPGGSILYIDGDSTLFRS